MMKPVTWLLFPLSFVMLIVGLCPEAAAADDSSAGGEHLIYLPLVYRPAAPSCEIPGTSYQPFTVASPPTDRPAESHPDLNLAIRGYVPTDAARQLVQYGGPTDPGAPQLDSLFAPDRVPPFTAAYRVHHWDWECNCRADPITDYDVTLLGMGTSPNQVLHVPDSSYDIGASYEVLVLYATENQITLKYTPEDNVVIGYTIHVEDVCVEPDLLALYRQLNAAGRDQLPALRGRQPFGRAIGNQIKVAIRDSGAFMDPRAQKDWWKEYP